MNNKGKRKQDETLTSKWQMEKNENERESK